MKRLLCVAMLGFVFACGGNAAENAPPATPEAPVTQETPAAPATEHSDDHHGKPATSGPVKAPGEASVGDTTKCPVSGEEFVVAADSPKVEHDGKTYYFCCASCMKKFEANPAKFLNPS